jgi:hypothetical protein
MVERGCTFFQPAERSQQKHHHLIGNKQNEGHNATLAVQAVF